MVSPPGSTDPRFHGDPRPAGKKTLRSRRTSLTWLREKGVEEGVGQVRGWGTKVGSRGELSRREGRRQSQLQGALRPGTRRGRRPRGASRAAAGRRRNRVGERLKIERSGWGGYEKAGESKGVEGLGEREKRRTCSRVGSAGRLRPPPGLPLTPS